MIKVVQLESERDEKQSEITTLTGKTPMTLWKTDLDAFLQHWEVGAFT
jgi:hypothetical protein